MQKLIVPIQPDPITGSPREAELINCILFNSRMETRLEVYVYRKNAQGQRLFDLANQLSNEQQRLAAQKEYKPTLLEYTTEGSFVDVQGNIDENGTIKEIDFIASITIGQFKAMLQKSDSDSLLESIKEFIGFKIQEISQRGQN
jgi:hypothetical protein